MLQLGGTLGTEGICISTQLGWCNIGVKKNNHPCTTSSAKGDLLTCTALAEHAHGYTPTRSTAWTDGDWFAKAMNAAVNHYTMYLVRSDASWDREHSALLSISNAPHLSQEMGAGATLLRASPGISTTPSVLPKTAASISTMITKTRQNLWVGYHTHMHG